MRKVRAVIAGTALVLASIMFALLLLEIGLRVLNPGAGFKWKNYAAEPVTLVNMAPQILADDDIGFVLRANRPDLELGALGNRLNAPVAPGQPAPLIPPRPIVAFGDSFTYGSEVPADKSWPAYLENLLQIPVVNSGVGGYGIDQMVLLAERIVPKVSPRLILLSFIPPDIDRVRMTVFSGGPKPYFEIVNGKLERRNKPVPAYHPSYEHGGIRSILGYSYLAYWVAQRTGTLRRWQMSKWEHTYAKIDSVQVSCLLMERLNRLGEAAKAPVIVIGQYGWSNFIPEGQSEVSHARTVLDCARKLGMDVVDTYGALRPVLPSARSGDFTQYYVNGMGHMTPAGNKLVAEVIAHAINERHQAVKSPSP